MAGVHFSFDNFKQLISLTIGLAERLDENRAESFTILYCNFEDFSNELIDSSLEQVLRTSDAISCFGKEYFFILPHTDKYGANVVGRMFSEFFAKEIEISVVSYPVDGETPKALIEELQNNVSRVHKYDLNYLD